MNKNYKPAKMFSLIPIVAVSVAVSVAVVLTLIAIICEDFFHIHSGFLAGPMSVAILVLMFGGIPFLIFSIFGIMYSVKSMKESKKGTLFLVLSIIDIFISIGLICLMCYGIFVVGPSV